MKELISFMSSDIFLTVGNIILALAVISASVLLVKALSENNTIAYLKKIVKQSEQDRIEQEELLRKIEGSQEKERLFYRLDLLLNQSGIKRIFPVFSTEYLVLISVVAGVVGLAVGEVVGGLAVGIVAAAIAGLAPYVVIKIKADMNYKKTEEQIIHFLNMVENYTKTQDNIITIFGKIYPFLEEPLATAVRECYMEATNTGNMSMAFRRLETKVVHEKFSEILRNLELCSRYEANYQAVVSTSRDIMSNYIKSRKKIKTIVDNAKIDFAMIILSTVILLGLIDSFVENGSIIDILTSGAGLIISSYMIFVIAYGMVSMITLTRR